MNARFSLSEISPSHVSPAKTMTNAPAQFAQNAAANNAGANAAQNGADQQNNQNHLGG